jgi:ribosome-binding ATPase YchF (GTP1/OBG family)
VTCKKTKEYASKYGREVIKLCSKVEEDMVDFDEAEKTEMLTSLGVEASGLDQIIKKDCKTWSYEFFTAGVKEVRAWTIAKIQQHQKQQQLSIMTLKKDLSVLK